MKTQLKLKMWLIALFIAAPIVTTGAVIESNKQAMLDVAVSNPYLQADKIQKAYLRVALTGFVTNTAGSARTPVNVAIVIDKSGSMTGEKIEKAKNAAIMALNRLNSNDIISVVTYDSTVSVIVPATKVSDKTEIEQMIQSIQAGNNTALFGGVSKGAQEVRKFLGLERVNRIILLSDGLANVGPSSPDELGCLGASLAKEGISVTTIGIGLGYNEDLMTKLAFKSDGSHYFAENASDLAGVFNSEFGQVLGVVAQDVRIDIECPSGIRPVRFLGRTGRISDSTASVSISNLYAGHEKFAMLEVEVLPGANGSSRKLAAVKTSYLNMKTHVIDKLATSLGISFTDSPDLVEKRADSRVMVDVVKLLAAEKNDLVIALRDKGQIDEARKAGTENSLYLKSNAVQLNSPALSDELQKQEMFNKGLEQDADYNRSRKVMREQQYQVQTQQQKN
ncbi:MAG: VWA domain-containing protein [Sedimentisphaerales bacterium]